MRVILENFDKQHMGLLKEMADILNFKIENLDSYLPEALSSGSAISELEDKEMTKFSMQASEQSLVELWDKEDDGYWNSYL